MSKRKSRGRGKQGLTVNRRDGTNREVCQVQIPGTNKDNNPIHEALSNIQADGMLMQHNSREYRVLLRQCISINQLFLSLISHSAKDDDFGRKLVQDLRQAFRSDEAVWYDSEGGLYGGESWWGRIVTELGKCDVFIIVLSPNSMNSKWVMKELDIANVEGKRVVPILYRQCDIRPDLRAIQIISFLEPIPYGAALNNLLQALKH